MSAAVIAITSSQAIGVVNHGALSAKNAARSVSIVE
jgi:hypothetical protein